MKNRKAPISFKYALLVGIGLGVIIGCRNMLWYVYYGEFSEFKWSRGFFLHIVNYGTWALLMPLVYYFITNYRLTKESPFREKFNAVAGCLAVCFLHEVVSNLIYHIPAHSLGAENLDAKKIRFILFSIPIAMIARVLEYGVLFAIITSLEYARKFKDKQIELAQLENQLSSAQLNALRLQLQPHFLFNTLNTISSLMEFNIKSAQKIVSKLGNLLRTVLDKNKKSSIPLRQELEFVRSYLDIEEARFADRLQIHYEIDKSVLDYKVPGLILQPLVENAIKHGFARNSENGNITLRAYPEGESIVLSIVDDGVGSGLSKPELLSKGIGLKNVNDRLGLLYRDQYSLDVVSSRGNGFEVRVKIPFNENALTEIVS